jgi:predicted Zn-dependent protease
VQALNLLPGGSRFLCGLIIFQSLLTSCSTRLSIPTVSDDPVELFVRQEAARIVAVSEDKDHFAEYQIHLSDFPRKDILGMSIGNRRIYISHRLAKFASGSSLHLWLLRQTLAHEIAHETAGHAQNNEFTWFNRSTSGPALSSVDVGLPGNVKFRNYSTEKELEADSIGLGYWKKLGWDCGIWVRILQSFEKQNYVGDIFHPTAKRLQQAQRACISEEKAGVI